MATINAAMVGYSSTLTASLELLGPAVLHAYKNSQDSGTDAKAVIDLFGWVTVKAADTPGDDSGHLLLKYTLYKPFLISKIIFQKKQIHSKYFIQFLCFTK